MVQINNGVRLNNPVSRLNEKSLIKPDANLSQTEGNNTGAEPSIRQIIGGDGTPGDPYVLNGRNNETDIEYLKQLAKEMGGPLKFTFYEKNLVGVVRPDGSVSYYRKK